MTEATFFTPPHVTATPKVCSRTLQIARLRLIVCKDLIAFHLTSGTSMCAGTLETMHDNKTVYDSVEPEKLNFSTSSNGKVCKTQRMLN